MRRSRLEPILDATRERVGELRKRSFFDLQDEANMAPPPADFLDAISTPGMSLVAEIKRRSPSAGEMDSGRSPSERASEYERGGAHALSVLTEPNFFSGSFDDLAAAKSASRLPVLRKDFIIDEFQIAESRAAGADSILLIVAAFEHQQRLLYMVTVSKQFGMEPLVEIHDEAEAERALEAGAKLIGINQRDLRTFEVDPGLASRLRDQIPSGVAVIAESGITDREDVVALEKAGLDGVLVGEALMRSSDPAKAVSDLLGRP